MKSSIKAGAARVGMIGGLVSSVMIGMYVMAGAASATPTDPVSDGFDDLQAKVTLYGGAIVALTLAVIILFFGIKFLRRGAKV